VHFDARDAARWEISDFGDQVLGGVGSAASRTALDAQRLVLQLLTPEKTFIRASTVAEQRRNSTALR
jgi:hypothetical protein